MKNSSEAFSEEQLQALRRLFSEGFTEIVLPHLDSLEDKTDRIEKRCEQIEEDMGEVKERLGSIENKLDSTIQRTDEHEQKFASFNKNYPK
jgi:chromosome segregation ATPase